MYYRVTDTLSVATPDHHEYGYEDRWDFLRALTAIVDAHGGSVGECIRTRHAFLLLRFRNPVTGQSEQAWVPRFLCTPAAPPSDNDPAEADNDPFAGVFGEGW